MSNPTNLQELADSLAASAEMAYQRISSVQLPVGSSYGIGYRDALLDTRATVLAMISEAAQAGPPYVEDGPVEEDDEAQDIPGLREFLESTPSLSAPVVRPILWQDSEGHLFDAWGGDYLSTQPEEAITAVRHGLTRERLHKAEPDDNSESYSMCKHCGKEVKHLPAGQGWVHEATGMVVG